MFLKWGHTDALSTRSSLDSVALVTDQNKCHTRVILLFDSIAVSRSFYTQEKHHKKKKKQLFPPQIHKPNSSWDFSIYDWYECFTACFPSKKGGLHSFSFSSIKTTPCYLASKVTWLPSHLAWSSCVSVHWQKVSGRWQSCVRNETAAGLKTLRLRLKEQYLKQSCTDWTNIFKDILICTHKGTMGSTKSLH